MHRRQFLEVSGVSLIGFAIGGCATATEDDAKTAGNGNAANAKTPDSKYAAGESTAAVAEFDDDVAPEMFGVGEDHLVFDADSVAYRIDPTGHRMVRLDDSNRPTAEFGGIGDSAGDLNYPIAAVVGAKDYLYVLERGNSRVQVFDGSGRQLSEFGGSELNHPNDLTVDAKGNIYVADTGNHRVVVFDPSGRLLRTIGSFENDGGELNGPRGVAITADREELHVIEFGSAQVQVYTLQGKPSYSYGAYGEGKGQFLSPSSIVAHPDGRVLVSDPVTGRISVFAKKGTFIGRFQPKNDQGSPAVPARLEMTHDNRLYVWTAGYQTPPV